MAKKKPIVISQPESYATEAQAEAFDAGQAEACPTYILRGDTRWGMLAMVALYRLVQEWGGPAELRREVEGVMREFEFWEEAHRGDPAA